MQLQREGIIKALAATSLALCGMMAALPASAAIDFTVSASNYRYTLTDLTPGDGQAAAFLGKLQQVSGYAQTSVQQGNTLVFGNYQTSDSYRDPPLTFSWSGGASGQASRTVVDGGVTGHFLSGSLAIADDMRGTLHLSSSAYNTFFELAPHTQVSLSLDAVVKLHATPGSTGMVSAAVGSYAQVDNEARQFASLSGEAGLLTDGFTFVGDVDRTETLTIALVNDTDDWQYGLYGFGPVADIRQGAVTAVPEAPAPAMLAAGVALLGLLGRRRARR